jgi:hypothetical protein
MNCLFLEVCDKAAEGEAPGSFIICSLNITIGEQLCHSAPRIDRASKTRMLDLVFNGIAPDWNKKHTIRVIRIWRLH